MRRTYDYLLSLTVISLVVAGIGGLSFSIFRNDGWFEKALGGLWRLEMAYPVVTIPATALALAAFLAWRNHRVALGRASRLPPYVVYALMAAGAFFIGRYVFHGVL